MNYLILEKYGLDYKNGIARCLNDEQFYEEILSLFLDDDSYARANTAYENRNYEELFSCLHELKGVCGNAALSELYDAVCPLVEILRDKCEPQEDITPLFEKVTAAYLKTREGIITALNE